MFTRHMVAAVLVLPIYLTAQSTRPALSGIVQDPAGLPVPDASIELTHTPTGLTTRALTLSDGAFHFQALPAGAYTLTATKDGFAPANRPDLLLRVGDRITMDIPLSFAAQTNAVDVSAPILQTTSGSVSMVVDTRRIEALPLDGRNFVPLIALSPGVSLPPGSLLPRVNGGRPRVSEYIYDGVSVLQPEPGQVAFYPIIDAIDEFRVETNSYSAEYGRANGGIIMVNQKSGTNDLHGTLFEFLRNEDLNARNLFAPDGPKPRFRRNQYGLVLGGPIQRNRTFFFLAWQGTRLNTGNVRTSTVPTLAQRLGIFPAPIFDPAANRAPFPANTVPASRFDPIAFSLGTRFPSPDSSATANNYRRVGLDNTEANQIDGRIDRYLGTTHRLFARYSILRDDTATATPFPGNIADSYTRAASLAAEHTWNVSPNSVNQLRFGYTRRRTSRSAFRSTTPNPIPNVPAASFADVLPAIDITGLQLLGPTASTNAEQTTAVTQFLDTYSRATGRHILKAGLDIRLQSLDVLQPANPAGNFQFTSTPTAALTATGAVVPNTGSSYASFLLGQVNRMTVDLQPEVIQPRARIAEAFLQDDWRLGRLTVNLGVRYTLNFPSTVRGDQGAVFNLATQQLDYLGRNGTPRSARNMEWLNFGPRVGLAWRATNSTVIRAGFGMTWIEQAGITTPFTTPLFPFIQTLTQQSLDNASPAFVLSQGPTVRPREPTPNAGLGQGVFAVQRDNGSGYAQQWNISLQKTIGKHWSFETGYLGSKLTRLGVPDINLNQLTVEQLARRASPLERPYPLFNTVALYRNNIGHSTYHSLQARAERRVSGNLTFSLAYTFSKLIDDAGAVFDSALLSGPVTNFQAADSFNKRLEKDTSTGSIPHILTAGFLYSWRGWQLAGIVRAQSGSPVAVTQANNLNAFAGFGIQRPNRVADPALRAAERSTGRWFQTTAFTAAPQYAIGNSSRNPVIGPGYRTFDLMLSRSFRLTERLATELRAEAFNAANTPPLGAPNGSYGSPAFGSITAALDPRVFELVLKLRF